MNITLEAVQRGYDAWAAKPHNAKWVRKIDGTPIANDIVATIFNSLRDDEEDRREQTLATVAAPDNGAPLEVLAAVHACARAWVPEARIVGNVRAGDIAKAIEAISTAPAQQVAALTHRLLDALDNAEELSDEVLEAFKALDNAVSTAPAATARVDAVVCIGEPTIAALRAGKEVSLTNGIILIPASDLSDITAAPAPVPREVAGCRT